MIAFRLKFLHVLDVAVIETRNSRPTKPPLAL
jgi:hypothetical protein